MSVVVPLINSQNASRVVKAEPVVDIDYWLLISAITLMCLGVVMVASASINIADKQYGDAFFYFRRQAAYVALGIVLMFFAMHIDMRFWEKLSPFLLLFSFILLLLVLLPGIGHKVNGAQRWLDLGFTRLQVSEPARLCLLIYLSSYLVRKNVEIKNSLKGFLKPMLVLGLASMLILLQPDFGAVVVLVLTSLGVMLIAGVRLMQFLFFIAFISAAFLLLIISSPYRLERLTAFLDPWSDPFNSGFQLTQALIAFGSGGVFGTGLGASIQKLFYLPEAHNDFLLAILAEELGLLGIILVLIVFAILIIRAFFIGVKAELSGHLFNAFLAYSLALWFSIQSFINIGVNMGLLPTKGLTLPLVSSGGSSLLIMAIAIGILLRIHKEVGLANIQAIHNKQYTNKLSERELGKKSNHHDV